MLIAPMSSLLALSALLAPAHARPPCRTAELRAAGWDSGAAHVIGEDYRPDSAGYIDSEIYPIRVHYRNEDDAERAETVILPAAEYAWQVEVVEMGWPAPPADDETGGSDALDYYLTDEETYGGAWTWGPRVDMVDGDDMFSIPAFIALDDNERDLTDELMPTFIAHEFNHVLQYGIDGVESTGFVWESTAEAMEELVLPDSNLYWLDVPDFQELPFASLLFDGYSSEIEEYNRYSFYEYGGSIAGLYLEQAFGSYDGTTLLQLWLNLAQGEATNEPDFVDALGMIGGDAAPTVGDVYLGLAEWRMFGGPYDDGAHFAEGSEWGRRGEVATEGTLSLAEIRGTSVSPEDEPYDLGTSYWEITPDGDLSTPLRLSLLGDESVAWGLVAAVWLDGEPARVVRVRGEYGEPLELEVDPSDATRIMVGVANLGAADLDAEGRHERVGFTLSFDAEDEDTGGEEGGGEEGGGEEGGGEEGGGEGGDSGGPDSGEPIDGSKTVKKGGCACAAEQSPSGAAGVLGLALGMIALRRRDRRREVKG